MCGQRRWNGWGDESVSVPVPDALRRLLEEAVGPGHAPRDIPLEQAQRTVPATRLPEHPLIATDPAIRLRHARGQGLPDLVALRSGVGLTHPDGVARPASQEEVEELIAFARERELALIPYGGGTSVVGHVNADPESGPALVVCLARMATLQRFDAKSRLATFEAGVSGPGLEDALRAHGHTLGHFPQSFEQSTLGGWVATRSSGQQSRGYGRIEDLFAGGTLIAPRGVCRLPPFPASAAGPDLRHLVLGSEGRLGILTSATVRVSPAPEMEHFDGVFLPAWEDAMGAARALAQSGIPISLLRVSTPAETQATFALSSRPRRARAIDVWLRVRGLDEHKCLAIVGVSGPAGQAGPARDAVLEMLRAHGAIGAGGSPGRSWRRSRFRAPYLRDTLWEMGYAVDTVETATTWADVPRTVESVEGALRAALSAEGERVHAFTHLSHVYATGASAYTTFVFRVAPSPQETLGRWRRLKRAASEAIVGVGGTISHQHGVGLEHAAFLGAEKGPLGLEALGRALAAFDPGGIMNPGKLLPREAR
jgi:alkyldihydroxyacetonephosphate synthase